MLEEMLDLSYDWFLMSYQPTTIYVQGPERIPLKMKQMWREKKQKQKQEQK